MGGDPHRRIDRRDCRHHARPAHPSPPAAAGIARAVDAGSGAAAAAGRNLHHGRHRRRHGRRLGRAQPGRHVLVHGATEPRPRPRAVSRQLLRLARLDRAEPARLRPDRSRRRRRPVDATLVGAACLLAAAPLCAMAVPGIRHLTRVERPVPAPT